MEVHVWWCMCFLLHCKLQPSSFTGTILFSTYNAIMEFDIDTGNVTVLVEQSDTVYAMDYDYKNRFIYFPRHITHDIVRFAYPSNTTTLQTVVQSLSYPTGIAVDSANDHLYWIDSFINHLSRCNLDGSNVTVLSTFIEPWTLKRTDCTGLNMLVTWNPVKTMALMLK
ncbi:low-density lipoprotein receptor-related protein 5-like [Mytilus trossulus]|uniref:low-density lipoprotein receptor-related protein 5-like n=1 Tax=Mytilus trossulus TaxID=6551 RepID=UPI003007EFB2